MTWLSLTFALLLLGFALAAYVMQLLRWLRVLQREHYQAGSVRRFYLRWATSSAEATKGSSLRSPISWPVVGIFIALVLCILKFDQWAVLIAAIYGVTFPRNLSIRGRTSALVWTRRLTTVAGVTIALSVLVGTVALVLPRPWLIVLLVLLIEPNLIDLAAWLTRPYEEHLANTFVREAQERLERVHPKVVAITGSFGKTSTKHHLAELLGGRHGVVPSPRSYNNRAGLSRAINENLTDGTRIFIAEMGTYGPGEIADLCSWCSPDIAIVTAIGPVHLERMGSIDVIERAKFEVTERAATVILNVDDERLAQWVSRLTSSGKIVRTGGAVNSAADVRVVTVGERWQITVDGQVVAIAPPVIGVREANLACAIAAALCLEVPIEEIIGRLSHLTSVPNRMVVATAPSGVMVIDDTFNANPAGASSALATLRTLPIHGRHVVVTPGMVELGEEQSAANRDLGRQIREMDGELVIVGRTNATALSSGYGTAPLAFTNRDQAVEWVRNSLKSGDGVLYLNDLPDHYP